VFGGKAGPYALLFGGVCLGLQIFMPYREYIKYLKWLTLVIFAYVATVFVVHVPWGAVLRATILPLLEWRTAYWVGLIAVLGTTISPYLFFWQSSQEAEEARAEEGVDCVKRDSSQAALHFSRITIDTTVWMALYNVVAFFIILKTAVTLHNSGSAEGIRTATDTAQALRPLAGHFAFLLFALGIIGTGLLAVPFLRPWWRIPSLNDFVGEPPW
jgi:Mn2+/Fe2+ NRAMP family transporter